VVEVVVPHAVSGVSPDRAQGEVVQLPDGVVVTVPVAADQQLGLRRRGSVRVGILDTAHATP